MPIRMPPKESATRGAELIHAWLYRTIPTHKDTYGRRRVAQVALDLGIHEGAVRQWARGRTIPTPKNMKALEAYCGIPVTAWFTPRAVTE